MCLVGRFFVRCTLDIYQFSSRFGQIQDQLLQVWDQLDQLLQLLVTVTHLPVIFVGR